MHDTFGGGFPHVTITAPAAGPSGNFGPGSNVTDVSSYSPTKTLGWGRIAATTASQTAAVGTAFASPFQAVVQNPDSLPVAGVGVNFTVQASTATAVFAGGQEAAAAPQLPSS